MQCCDSCCKGTLFSSMYQIFLLLILLHIVLILLHDACVVSKALCHRHFCIVFPLYRHVARWRIGWVVHVGVGFQFEGVEQIAGMSQPSVVAAGRQPIVKISGIEAEPRVVGASGLIEMYHLVVFQGAAAPVEGCSVLFAVRDDVAEEGHSLVAFPNPARLGDGWHVGNAARASGPEHHQQDIHR